MIRVLVALVLVAFLTACGGSGGGGGGGNFVGGGSNNGGSTEGGSGGGGSDDGGSDDGGSDGGGSDDGGSDDGGSDGGGSDDDGSDEGSDDSGSDDGGPDDDGSDDDSGGGSTDPEEEQNASPGGIWQGEGVGAYVTETGEFHIFFADTVNDSFPQYFGSLTTSGNDVSGEFTGYPFYGETYEDGSTHGSGTLTGTVQERSTLTLDVTFETSAGTEGTESISLAYNAMYERESSLEAIAGTYYGLTLGTTVTIYSDGEIFAQSPAYECVLNGTVSIIDPQYNLYRVEHTVSNCLEPAADLNGLEFSGFATIQSEQESEDSGKSVVMAVTAPTEDGGMSLLHILIGT